MSRACPSCNRNLRRGKGRRAWVMDPDGTIKSGVVCLRCAARAVAFVVPPATTVAPLCCVCKRDTAAVCAGCFGRQAESSRELTKANVALRARLESE